VWVDPVRLTPATGTWLGDRRDPVGLHLIRGAGDLGNTASRLDRRQAWSGHWPARRDQRRRRTGRGRLDRRVLGGLAAPALPRRCPSWPRFRSRLHDMRRDRGEMVQGQPRPGGWPGRGWLWRWSRTHYHSRPHDDRWKRLPIGVFLVGTDPRRRDPDRGAIHSRATPGRGTGGDRCQEADNLQLQHARDAAYARVLGSLYVGSHDVRGRPD